MQRPSFQDNNQEYQNNNQTKNRRKLLVIPRLPRNPTQLLSRAIQSPLMSLRRIVHLIQHLHLTIQLIPNLYAQIPLPPDADPQPIQLLVLFAYHIPMVFVNLYVVEVALVWWRRIGRIVAVREERGAIGGFLGVDGWCIGKADGF